MPPNSKIYRFLHIQKLPGFVAGIILVVVFAAIGVLFQLASFKEKSAEKSPKI